MRTLLTAIALAGCVAASLGAAAAAQIPWPVHPSPDVRDPKASFRKSYTEHFGGQSSFTNIHLHTHLHLLYPDTPLTVTASPSFELLSYAAAHSADGTGDGDITVVPDPAFDEIKTAAFAPPLRRGGNGSDAGGRLVEQVWFAGYKVAVGGQELTAVVASWPTINGITSQWHLLGDRAVAGALVHTVGEWATRLENGILVYENMWWHPDPIMWKAVQKASWDDVILEAEFKRRLMREYRSFFKSEKTYKDLGVPWKRGLIFLGPPGNGKTVSLKALMKDVGVPTLYVKSLESYGPAQLSIREVFSRARAEAPCVLVFEDLDSMITDRNRAFFLNEVDGMDDNDGLLLIGTTNHFDRLDPALSNRPSRFDRKYFFPNPTHDERVAYARYWQHKLESNSRIAFPDALVDEVADTTGNFSFAYMKEAFVAALINLADSQGDGDGDGDGSDGKDAFAIELRKQIKFLRDELEREDPDSPRLHLVGGRGFTRAEPEMDDDAYSFDMDEDDEMEPLEMITVHAGPGGGGVRTPWQL